MTKVPNLDFPKFERPIKKKKKVQAKKLKNQARHDRLLRLFDGDGYEEFHTPKYIFVKQWNGNNGRWQVAIYPIESWHKKQKPTIYQQQTNHLRSIQYEED